MPTMTAAQRHAQARKRFNAYLANCPSHRPLASISDKWVVLLLSALGDGPHRYAELGRRVPGVSQKMLTRTLRHLERDGLVNRKVTPSVPIRVDYALTPLGGSLLPVIKTIKQWAESNMKCVEKARNRYDARQ